MSETHITNEPKWWDDLTDSEVECRLLRHRFTILSVHELSTGNLSYVIYCPACHAWAHDVRYPDGRRARKRQYVLQARYRKPDNIPPGIDTPTHAEWAQEVAARWNPQPLDNEEESWRDRARDLINNRRSQRTHRR